MLKKFAFALGAIGLEVATIVCNTVRGAGQDIESVANDGDKEI